MRSEEWKAAQSRRSSAYHRAMKEAIAKGMTKDEAKALGREDACLHYLDTNVTQLQHKLGRQTRRVYIALPAKAYAKTE